MIDESLFVTGWCPPSDDCPDGYWCLSDGAPPGYQPIPEFPEAPALPTECAIMPHDVAENTTLGGFIDVEDGTGDIIVWSETTGSHAGYIERWDKELSLRQWRIDGETHFPVDNNYHNTIDFPGKVIKLLDGSLLATHDYNVSNGEIDQTRFLLARYSMVDGGLINYKVPDSSLGNFYHETEGAAAPDEYAYGAIRLFVQRRAIGSDGFNAIYYWNWELNTDSSIIVRPVKYGGSPATCIHTTKNGDIFLGMPEYSITANVYNPGGAVMKFNESNADLTPFLDGEIDNPATGYNDYVGYKMWSDDKYFIIFGGASQARTTYPTAYGNYAMYIYDVNTLTFIKKIWDPFSEERVTMNYYGSGFGMGFSKYGNFYYVGMPNDSYKTDRAISKGKTFVYDNNFNFLYEIGQLPILPDGSDSGNTLLVTSDRVYIDIARFGDWGIHSMKVCKV